MRSNEHYEIEEPEDWDRPTRPRVWLATHYINDDMVIGEVNVTFDREKVYNLFQDFPSAFTQEQLNILREEMPHWFEFFKARLSS